MGTATTTTTTQNSEQTITAFLISKSTTTDKIDLAAAQVMTLIHENHDNTTKI